MAEFTKTDFKRIPGRLFENVKTGEIITRRQYDKRFGNLAKNLVTSYERLAKLNKDKQGSNVLLKPARGRTSKLKAPLEKQQEIIQGRKKLLAEKIKQEKIQKALNQKRRYNKSVSLKNFRPGKRSEGGTGLGRDFKLPFDYQIITEFINQAKHFKRAYAYMVGFDYFDVETQKNRSHKIFYLRDFSMDFKFEEFENMMELIASHIQGSEKTPKEFIESKNRFTKSEDIKNDIIPLNAIVYVTLKMESAKTHARKHGKKFD